MATLNVSQVESGVAEGVGYPGHHNASAIVARALRRLGYVKRCSRCGGTGSYRFCPRFGTTCFKCGGATITPITYTPALLNAVKRDIEAGLYRQSRDEKRDLDPGRKPTDNRKKTPAPE